ncbi:DUF2207 domain-containing protein [Leucobacter triazinivorans]|uniref:DUF2207 domain-containing protein n=1 Tax=Leucobacter triazinivorans TaxID=1784719 RepID=A0A4P6KC16_9MICO|nr:DUF2207 domain-containing protein [Leucobacter triazinivorans]QBE47431.1 DUF2207 domain-containing protein [Leucobacter triazinivorans]
MRRLRRPLKALGIALGGALLLGLGLAAPAAADVSDFSYDSWHVEYRIGTDAEGRAIAEVTETLTARFPDTDQNRGLVRGLPIDYEGASTDPRDFTVTDEAGDPVPFEIEREDGFVAVLTGDDRYMHGVQTYVIGYTLSDVILARDDGAADEFYWDLTDFEHLQPIDAFTAEISFSEDLAEQLNGDARCYFGAPNSTAECAIERDGAVFRVSTPGLGAREGVTAAIGLHAGSVVQPPQRLPNFALDVLPYFVAGAALLVTASGAVAVASLRRRRRTARGTVIAQYDVPAQLPPLIAAPIAGVSAGPVPAEIVHLAIAGALRIEDGEPEQGLFGPKPAQPVLRVLDAQRAADPLDRQTMQSLFPSLEAGTAFELPKKSESFGKRMTALGSAGSAQALERGYFTKEHSPLARLLGLVGLGLLAVLAILVVFGIALRSSPTAFVCIVIGAVALVLAIVSAAKHRVYTTVGAEWREYLEGVRLFIRVAEADRIQMLQSYQGAERRQDGTVDVIHLYEKLLPYAMLFGMEKEWSRVLTVRYQEQQGYVPLWYPAVVAHGLGSLDSTLSSFTSSLSSSVSYTSSSSGGSSGGGFSGGGGGGGFSGGR